MDEPLEGTTLGRYRVGRLLGTGGMGAVHAGVQEPLGRPVAIKVLRPEISKNAEIVARFKREAELAASLSHPNIAQVTDFGVEDGRAFLVMDLLEGESLGALLEREGRVSEGRVQRIAMQVLTALATAHERGVVHRDLKPENVFVQRVSGMELVKLLDFGIARMLDTDHSMTSTGAVLGTPAYMSPEQARGRRVDARSDVFSIGAVFYEMLAGRRPFEADNYHELMFAVAEQTPTPLVEIDPQITPALAAIVERAMHKTPDARFASAKEMRDAIGELTGLRESPPVPVGLPATRTGEPAHAFAATMPSDPGPAGPAPTKARRPIARWLAGACAAALLLGLGAWAAMEVAGGQSGATTSGAQIPAAVAEVQPPMQPIGAPSVEGPPSAAPAARGSASARASGSAPGSASSASTSAPSAAPATDDGTAAPASGSEPVAVAAAPARAAARARTVRVQCAGSAVELPIVQPRDRVSVSSAANLEGVPHGTISIVRSTVHAQASAALTTCYRGRPILQGQDYDLTVSDEGAVQRVEPRVYCPLEPALVSCAQGALREVTLPPPGAPYRVRVSVSIDR